MEKPEMTKQRSEMRGRREQCQTCRYMDPNGEVAYGSKGVPVCRRFPPLVQEVGGTAWPGVKPLEDWCGEWKSVERNPAW